MSFRNYYGVTLRQRWAPLLVGIFSVASILAACGATNSAGVAPIATATMPPTLTSVATATATPTQPPSDSGGLKAPWKPLNTQKYTALDFMPGDPATIFGCAGTTQTTMPTPVDVSHDGGATWHTIATLPAATNCDLRIDPFQPQTIALLLFHCGGGSCDTTAHPLANQCFRSTDGGATWAELKSPVSGGSFEDHLAWTTQALFTVIDEQGPSGLLEDVLASVNGAPFTVVSKNHGLLGQQISEARQFAGVGATMYIGFDPPTVSSIGLPAVVVAQSADNGATWSQPALKNGSGEVQFLAGSGDGQRIIGHDASSQHLAYSANGTSWTLAPATPSGLAYISGFTTVTPDGTIFAEFSNGTGAAATRKLYRAAPGATSWSLVQDLTSAYAAEIFTVSWNASGQPQAVWASVGMFPAQFYWLAL